MATIGLVVRALQPLRLDGYERPCEGVFTHMMAGQSWRFWNVQAAPAGRVLSRSWPPKRMLSWLRVERRLATLNVAVLTATFGPMGPAGSSSPTVKEILFSATPKRMPRSCASRSAVGYRSRAVRVRLS